MMSVCTPPSRKHSVFGLARLARGLHASQRMKAHSLFLIPLFAALTLPAATGAQEQLDAVTQINGESLPSDASKVYFNAENCADPSNTVYDVTLVNAASVTQAYLWAGTQNAGCEQNDKRMDTQLLCRPMTDSTPAQVGHNATG